MQQPSAEHGETDRLTVRITAPARLHLGFIDVSGSLGRSFGSIGLTLDDFATVIDVRRSAQSAAHGPNAARALDCLRTIADIYRVAAAVEVCVRSATPAHIGLGSGTQLALAVGTAFGALFDVPVSIASITAGAGRGRRSGIGVAAFEHGGFIVDGGRAHGGGYPPAIARMAFPAAWRVFLALDRNGRGLSGEAELAAFRNLHPFPEAAAAHLAHLVLMRVMPALAEADCASFGAGIGEIQRAVGDYFAPAQGGRYTSPAVAEVLNWLQVQGVAGVGQSSWGPTGFAIVDSAVSAHALLVEARKRFGHLRGLEFVVARGRNRGYELARLTHDAGAVEKGASRAHHNEAPRAFDDELGRHQRTWKTL